MTIIHFVLKGKWYRMIESLEKPEEYRDITEYWQKRLEPAIKALAAGETPIARFYHGYKPDRPHMDFEIKAIWTGIGHPKWGAESGVPYYIIELGKRLPVHAVHGSL